MKNRLEINHLTRAGAQRLGLLMLGSRWPALAPRARN
jgi:hypothetical protein